MKHRIGWLILVATLVGTACAPVGAGGPATTAAVPAQAAPKHITLAILGDLPSLYTAINPAGTTRGQEIITDSLNANLAHRDANTALVPQLAASVPSSENGAWKVSADGKMETRWTLRDNLAWHDGSPLASDDLLFTFTLYRDKSLPDFYAVSWDAIEDVTAPDAKTIVVNWKRPFIEADSFIGLILPLPAHLLRKAYTDDKATLVQQKYFSSLDFVGAGPYRAKEWQPGSHFVLEAFDKYVAGRPKIDTIQINIIPDTNTLLANLLAGSVDASVGKTISLEQAMEVRQRWTEGHVDIAPAAGIGIFPQLLAGRAKPEVELNPQFRRALLSAVNRQQMVDELMGGLTQVHESIVNPGDPLYAGVASRVVHYPYDARKATQLIQDIGYTKGADGMFRDVAGQPLKIELRTVSVDIDVKAELAVQDYWQKAGVAVDAFVIPPQRAQDLEYRSTYPGYEIVRSGADLANLKALHSTNIAAAENNWKGGTRTSYKNSEFDGLIDRYYATIPLPDRQKTLGDIIGIMTGEVVQMGLFYDVNPTAISNRLANAASLVSQDASWNINEWDLK